MQDLMHFHCENAEKTIGLPRNELHGFFVLTFAAALVRVAGELQEMPPALNGLHLMNCALESEKDIG